MPLLGKNNGGMSVMDKIAMLASVVAGDSQGVQDIQGRGRQKLLQQAAMQAAGLLGPAPGQMRQAPIGNEDGEDITAAFAPQMEQGPSRRRSPEEITQGLAQLMAQVPGFNPKPFVDLAQYSRPNLTVTPSGEAIDQYNPSNEGRVFPKMGEGQIYRGGQVSTAPGFAQSVGEIEGAKTRAQEGGKAAFDVIELQMPDGTTQQIPRDVAVQAIMQSLIPGAGGQAPGGIGRSRPPETTAYATDSAKAQAERDFTRPKAEAALSAMDAKTKLVDDAIARALGRVGGWTAGAGAMLSGLPGSPAKDLQSDLETIKANLGFDELQTMRDNSPTGGALGQVAVQELEALRATISSLDQAQSPEALAASLRRVQEQRAGSAQRRREAFERTYSGSSASSAPRSAPSGARPSRSALEAEARRRGLIR